MSALRFTVFISFVHQSALGGDSAAFVQTAKPEFELSFKSATTEEQNGADVGDNALIYFKLGQVHNRAVDLLQVTLLPRSHKRNPRDIDPRYESKSQDLGRRTVAELFDQYIGMVKNFPTDEIIDVLKPLMQKKDHEVYQRLKSDMGKLEHMLSNKDLRETLQRNVDILNKMLLNKDVEKILGTIVESTETISTEKDSTKRKMLMQTAGDSMGTLVKKVSSGIEEMSRDIHGQMRNTLGKE